MRVADQYFRVARVPQVVRLGLDGPEPPRPADANRVPPHAMRAQEEFLDDADTDCGPELAALKAETATAVTKAGGLPPDNIADERRALQAYPDVLFLGTWFTIGSQADGSWGAFMVTEYRTPAAHVAAPLFPRLRAPIRATRRRRVRRLRSGGRHDGAGPAQRDHRQRAPLPHHPYPTPGPHARRSPRTAPAIGLRSVYTACCIATPLRAHVEVELVAGTGYGRHPACPLATRRGRGAVTERERMKRSLRRKSAPNG